MNRVRRKCRAIDPATSPLGLAGHDHTVLWRESDDSNLVKVLRKISNIFAIEDYTTSLGAELKTQASLTVIAGERARDRCFICIPTHEISDSMATERAQCRQ
jgi:hypothetical protein